MKLGCVKYVANNLQRRTSSRCVGRMSFSHEGADIFCISHSFQLQTDASLRPQPCLLWSHFANWTFFSFLSVERSSQIKGRQTKKKTRERIQQHLREIPSLSFPKCCAILPLSCKCSHLCAELVLEFKAWRTVETMSSVMLISETCHDKITWLLPCCTGVNLLP